MFSRKLNSVRQEQESRFSKRLPNKKMLVTATPPTPNGDLHLGHLSGPYLRADIHTRYLRMQGIESYFLSGIDDHQSYVSLKSKQMRLTESEIADRFANEMLNTLKISRIEMDLVSRPRESSYHFKLVQSFFERLYSEGKLTAKDAPSPYCEICDKYLFEAYIRGKCPHCGTETGGNACEECGRPNDCVDLIGARCNLCEGQPSVRTFTRLYFPLGQYEQQLRDYYKSTYMNPHLSALCEQMIAEGLPDIAVTHFSNWGIPVPVDGYDGQCIYVWFEMAPGYMASTQQLNEVNGLPCDSENCWQTEDIEVVQFFGFDNGYFHAVLFPALFFAYSRTFQPPRTFVMNEFYLLDGSKFSTSRNHAIWGGELLDRVPADLVRFYLSYNGPETEQTNFTMSDFEDTVQRELIKGWQSWLHDLGTKVSTEDADIASVIEVWTQEQCCFYRKLKEFIVEIASTYEAKTFSPQRATRVLCELVRTARSFGKAEDHWKQLRGRRKERRTALALEVTAAKVLALLSFPIMPDFATLLWHDLGGTTPLLTVSWEDISTWGSTCQEIRGLDRIYFPDVTRCLA